jgi:hypothetical protein
VLPHLGDSPKDIVTWIEIRLHDNVVGVVGLRLLPSLSGDLGRDLSLCSCSTWVVNLLISASCRALMKGRDLLAVE